MESNGELRVNPQAVLNLLLTVSAKLIVSVKIKGYIALFIE